MKKMVVQNYKGNSMNKWTERALFWMFLIIRNGKNVNNWIIKKLLELVFIVNGQSFLKKFDYKNMRTN